MPWINTKTNKTENTNSTEQFRNTMLKCTNCGTLKKELEWDEVWSHTHGGFISFCCPNCHVIGKSKYEIYHHDNKPGRYPSDIEKIQLSIQNKRPIKFK